MPALHNAVLYDNANAALSGMVDEPSKALFCGLQVLSDGSRRITSDERSHCWTAQQCSGIDACDNVLVHCPASAWVRVKVVVVERERGYLQIVLIEQTCHPLGVARAEAVHVN